MKTTKSTFMKVLSMVALTLTLVSCGKDNKSGGSSGSGVLIGNLGVNAQSSQYVNTVVQTQAQKCQQAGRVIRQFQMPIGANGMGVAVGVTSNYSAAIASSQQGVIQFYLCEDPQNPFASQPQVVSQGGLEQTYCQGLFNIRGMQIKIMTRAGMPYDFVFRPSFDQQIQCVQGGYSAGYGYGYYGMY